MTINSEKIENLLSIIEALSRFDEQVLKSASSILKDRETCLVLAQLLEQMVQEDSQSREEKVYKEKIIEDLHLERIKSYELSYLIEKTMNIKTNKLNKDDKIDKIKIFIKNSSIEQANNFKRSALTILKEKKDIDKKDSINDLMKWSDIIIKKNEDLDK